MGFDFESMSAQLNKWMNSSSSGVNAIPCHMWRTEELQQLQAVLYFLREDQFDHVYQATTDSRRMRSHVLKVNMSISLNNDMLKKI